MARFNAIFEIGAAPQGHSEERRRLLRAAAAAPLVATLPSGAAYAFASASQCVIDSQKESFDENGIPPMERPNTDEWVRKTASKQIYRKGPPPVSITLYLIDGTWYDINGAVVSQVPPEGFSAFGDSTPVYVLQIYKADYKATGDPNAPNGVHPVGFWPVEKTSKNTGNMGITGTCLCSVDPQFGNSQIC